jgi:mono/diheme cytochrome c family protein
MKLWSVWVVIILVVGIGATWLFSRAGLLGTDQPVVINGIAAPPLPRLEPANVARGKVLYAQHCAACHGANLEGKPDWKIPLADSSLPPPPHDSTGHTWHHPDELLIDIVANGGDPKYTSQMPAFKDQLTREQIAAVLDFIKSTWGREEREYQWWMTSVGSQQ